MVDLYAIVRRLTGCELITASDTKALTDAVDGLIAELEQVKQERDDAKQALQNEIVAHGNTIRGKAGRLAGARAVTEAMKAAADQLEKIAFNIPAPNPHTPQLVTLAIGMRDFVLKAAMEAGG